MTSLEHLLPAADESVRCADHSRNLSVDPGGTAIRADRVVLVGTPLPWPKPVFDHPNLVDIAPILKASVIPTRTLAFVIDQPGPGSAEHFTVITFDRDVRPDGSSAPEVIERQYRPRSADELLALATAIADDDGQALSALAISVAPLANPVALICTQGSHDVCCGSEGARFAAEAEAIADLTVYRVSHTGGHRFAPTAMTLPDGRMWADMDLDLLRQILSRTGETADVVDRCRGWWGAETGPAQMAERAVFEAVGWELESGGRTVEMGDVIDGATRVGVHTGDRNWEVTVTVGREIPTIACRMPGGLPSKRSVEYNIRGIDERPTESV